MNYNVGDKVIFSTTGRFNIPQYSEGTIVKVTPKTATIHWTKVGQLVKRNLVNVKPA